MSQPVDLGWLVVCSSQRVGVFHPFSSMILLALLPNSIGWKCPPAISQLSANVKWPASNGLSDGVVWYCHFDVFWLSWFSFDFYVSCWRVPFSTLALFPTTVITSWLIVNFVPMDIHPALIPLEPYATLFLSCWHPRIPSWLYLYVFLSSR